MATSSATLPDTSGMPLVLPTSYEWRSPTGEKGSTHLFWKGGGVNDTIREIRLNGSAQPRYDIEKEYDRQGA
jgi:hypothetical protein